MTLRGEGQCNAVPIIAEEPLGADGAIHGHTGVVKWMGVARVHRNANNGAVFQANGSSPAAACLARSCRASGLPSANELQLQKEQGRYNLAEAMRLVEGGRAAPYGRGLQSVLQKLERRETGNKASLDSQERAANPASRSDAVKRESTAMALASLQRDNNPGWCKPRPLCAGMRACRHTRDPQKRWWAWW